MRFSWRIASCLTLCIVVWFGLALGDLGAKAALAGPLEERLLKFPQWQEKPPVQPATGDLFYPTWFRGDWEVSSTLVDLAAPLAPSITSPGFESNRQLLHQPIRFQVRFLEMSQTHPLLGHPLHPVARINYKSALSTFLSGTSIKETAPLVVSDRAFNGLSLSRAYLGPETVLAVKVDPSDPTRQITLFSQNRQLTSTVTGRATEALTTDRFITSEVFQQFFRGRGQPYFNEVENTTAYQHYLRQDKANSPGQPEIVADQVTAVYLSAQDPQYFKAKKTPVALYRYRLEFFRLPPKAKLSSE